MGGPVAIVGRERELSRLLAALGEGARLVLVTGDAGVGKTRFTGEGMTRAGAGGMVALRGECLPLAGALPLLPAASALSELAGLEDGTVLAAALATAPGFVRGEVGRLLPQLEPSGGPGSGGREGKWRRERLFAAVAELLDAVAGKTGAGVGLVVEDVHWADGETLDLLTFLSRPGRRGGVCVVVTCRGDEAPLAAPVAGWLAQARGAAGAEEIILGPLSRTQVAAQVAALAGGPVPAEVVDELFARAEGNPFFTEQLVAAALAGGAAGAGLRIPAELPARLAGLLTARAGRCAGDARAVLDALAVAGRPLKEGLLGEITGLEPEVVRRGLRELAAARLLAEETASGGGHRPRHALLAEAVTGGLLSGERAMLHEGTARALEMAGDEMLAAEVAGHWQAAGCPAKELPARVTAAGAAERVFGYAEAAAHWQRALELWPDVPDAPAVAGIDLPRVYVRAIDAVQMGGDRGRAGELAEEAYRRFAGHTDADVAAVIHLRAAVMREYRSPAAGRPLIETALRLFADCPASADKAEAWFRYAANFLFHAEGRLEASRTALNRALDIAEAAGATVLSARVLSWLALNAFLRGHLDEGFSFLQRGTAQADASQEPQTVMWLASYQSEALLSLARFHDAAKTAQQAVAAGRRAGLPASFSPAVFLAATAAEALLAMGRAAEAARLIDPLTTGPPTREQWATHQARADIDLLRGNTRAAATRQQQISSFSFAGSIDNSRRRAQRAAELALWRERPSDALAEVRQVLPLFAVPDLTILCGRLLGAGMRACADLAEQARARREASAAEAAADAADGLALWVGQMGGAPFTDHPFVATIPAERATWDAERTRLAGPSDPAAWAGAAKAWQELGCPHWAGYAWWRQAQAQLDAGQPATTATAALRTAAAAARGHAPLLAQVQLLAERARILLDPPGALPGTPPPTQAPVPYGLTRRELTVLRLLAAGRTNAQIGTELFISPRTAGVHVTNILRKLGVTGRVQAAAVAERAGLLDTQT
jgi:DNA-binding CsgD family transcriptional regulator/tetratricopeptide (TPR) repeat protein